MFLKRNLLTGVDVLSELVNQTVGVSLGSRLVGRRVTLSLWETNKTGKSSLGGRSDLPGRVRLK